MPRYSREAKEEVLERVRKGEKLSEVARLYGIRENTLRTWVERDGGGSKSEILELSRLRRENEALLRLVGQLTYESAREKKNKLHKRG
jgi:transposase-like protein